MAPWRISLGAICFVLLALSQKKRRVIVLVIALTLGSVVMSMRQQSLESSAVANYFQSTVEVRALITTDPQRTAKRVRFRKRQAWVGWSSINARNASCACVTCSVKRVNPNLVLVCDLVQYKSHGRGYDVVRLRRLPNR